MLKGNYKLFTLLLFSILLTACSSGSPEKVEPMVKEVVGEVFVDDTAEDYVEVVKTLTCDVLNDDIRKENCLRERNELVAEYLLSEIKRTFDMGRCNLLSVSMARGCREGIEVTGVKGPISEKELAQLEEAFTAKITSSELDTEDDTIESRDIIEYDLGKCTGFSSSGLKEYCEEQLKGIISRQELRDVVDAGDVSKCADLEDEYVRFCEEEFGIYTEEELLEETEA